MAEYREQNLQQEEALKESLYAARYCLTFNKELSGDWQGENGCLGYPAFILLVSIIDTIGSFFKEITINENGKKKEINNNKSHFYILNEINLFNLKLEEKTIEDFYKTYRNSIVHNNSLPGNNFLKYDSNDKNPFQINETDKKITGINLYELFIIVEKALFEFLHLLKDNTFSFGHTLTRNLNYMKKPHTGAYGIVIKEEGDVNDVIDTSKSSGFNS